MLSSFEMIISKYLFKRKDVALGCDLSTRGVEMDLEGVCVTYELLTSDRESPILFLLGFENESWVN